MSSVATTDINVRRFTGQLDTYGLVQHVTGAIHFRGLTLDVIITRESSSIIKGSLSIVDPCLCGLGLCEVAA